MSMRTVRVTTVPTNAFAAAETLAFPAHVDMNLHCVALHHVGEPLVHEISDQLVERVERDVEGAQPWAGF